MQVTITNATSEAKFISFLYKQLDAGESVTVSKAQAELQLERQFLIDVENGDLTLAFAVEAGDSAPTGNPGTLESFANAAGLPDPASRPLFSTVWQVDQDYAVWTDGSDWRTAAGAVTS